MPFKWLLALLKKAPLNPILENEWSKSPKLPYKKPFKSTLVNSIQRVVKGHHFWPTNSVGFKKKAKSLLDIGLVNKTFKSGLLKENKKVELNRPS